MLTSLNKVIELIENASAVDPFAERANRISRRVLKPPLRDALGGSAIGHPIHPVVMLLPSGCWLSATVLDASGRAEYRPAATRLVATGALAAIPTALTGLNDWLDTTRDARRVGIFHASANYIGLAFAVASWGARRADHHRLGVGLSIAGNVALLAAGWLGGHLAYSLGVGSRPNTTARARRR